MIKIKNNKVKQQQYVDLMCLICVQHITADEMVSEENQLL